MDKIFNGKEWINTLKPHSDWEFWDNIHSEPAPGLLFAYSKQEIFKQKKETKQVPHGTVDEENKQQKGTWLLINPHRYGKKSISEANCQYSISYRLRLLIKPLVIVRSSDTVGTIPQSSLSLH